jgi:hypothetical protein|tara:strand:- start:2327 stop:2608 length:282 start_codon:yes stop_codon:yes gene_type:complete
MKIKKSKLQKLIAEETKKVLKEMPHLEGDAELDSPFATRFGADVVWDYIDKLGDGDPAAALEALEALREDGAVEDLMGEIEDMLDAQAKRGGI